MIKARPKYTTDLYGTIYIDNIQKVVVINLSNHSDNIFFWCWIHHKQIPGCMTYVVHPGSYSLSRVVPAALQHLCQRSFYKIFIKFRNSKKMYLKLF